MIVSDIMVSPVIVTQSNKTLKHVKDLFDRKKVSAIPVLTIDGKIEGIITASDLAREHDDNEFVENVMTIKTYAVSSTSGVQGAAKMMDKHHVHHLVVIDNGQVVGIISSMDFVKLIAKG